MWQYREVPTNGPYKEVRVENDQGFSGVMRWNYLEIYDPTLTPGDEWAMKFLDVLCQYDAWLEEQNMPPKLNRSSNRLLPGRVWVRSPRAAP